MVATVGGVMAFSRDICVGAYSITDKAVWMAVCSSMQVSSVLYQSQAASKTR